MSFLPPPIPSLDEVLPENLIINEVYLIDFTSYDNQNVKERGKFIGHENDGKFSIFKMPSMGSINVPFLNSRTRYYSPKTQKILDESAQRQYVAQETARLINEKTGTELVGETIVDDFNNPKPPSGGKRVKIKKHKNTKRKRKQIRHKKRKSRKSRKMK